MQISSVGAIEDLMSYHRAKVFNHMYRYLTIFHSAFAEKIKILLFSRQTHIQILSYYYSIYRTFQRLSLTPMQRGKGKNSCDGRKNQNNQSEQILHLPLCIGVRLKTLKGSVNTIIAFLKYPKSPKQFHKTIVKTSLWQ